MNEAPKDNSRSDEIGNIRRMLIARRDAVKTRFETRVKIAQAARTQFEAATAAAQNARGSLETLNALIAEFDAKQGASQSPAGAAEAPDKDKAAAATA